MHHPRIGITTDNDPDAPAPGRFRLSRHYTTAVATAGGVPVMLPQEPHLAASYVALCDGLILTGGRDPRTEAFGEPTHPCARPLDPARQAFELALLAALAERPDRPALGICLGMQMMALHAGGRLNQHLTDTLGEDAAAIHRDNNTHPVTIHVKDTLLLGVPAAASQPPQLEPVTSSHHQAIADPGAMRTIATGPDGVIEAIDDPAQPDRFYLGVQWHPERGGDGPLNRGLIQRFVDAARATTSVRSP